VCGTISVVTEYSSTTRIRWSLNSRNGTPINTVAGSHIQSQQFAMCRLPKLTLPTFAGNPLHWLTFWNSFQAAIHLDPNLTGVQKFNYLKPQLEGDAARIIKGFPLTDQNYSHAVAILQNRFGQPHKATAAHMKALVKILRPSNSLNSLRVFHDTIESHYRGLSSLGKSELIDGDLIVLIILGKRDPTKSGKGNRYLKIDVLATHVSHPERIRVLESGSDDLYKSQSQLVNTKTKPKSPLCVFCKGSHAAH